VPATLQIRLLSINDEEVLRALERILPEIPEVVGVPNIEWSILDNDHNVRQFAQARQTAEIQEILNQNGELFKRVALSFATSSLPIQQGTGSVYVNRDVNGALAHLQLPQQWDGDLPKKTAVTIAFRREFHRFERSVRIDSAVPELAEFYTRRANTILRLEELISKVAVENDSHRRTLEDRLAEDKRRLDVDYQKGRDNLDSEYKAKPIPLLNEQPNWTRGKGIWMTATIPTQDGNSRLI
jgi:hypothetical protein